MQQKKMLEPDIKVLILNYLRKKNRLNSSSIIMNELTVGNHTRRVDLAILSDGKLTAFEIKSEADNLTRIDGQINTYLKYFDKVVVVSDSKFTQKLSSKLPNSVGVWELNKNQLKTIVRGRLNKIVENKTLLDFMDVVDMKKLCSNLNIKTKHNRKDLRLALLNAPNKTIRDSVELALLRKFHEKNQIFFNLTNKRKIKKDDLKLLSRFYQTREINNEYAQKKKKFWLNINKHVSELGELY